MQQKVSFKGNKMKEKFYYVIKTDGKEVRRGLNPEKKFDEISEKNPDKEVTIAWPTKEKDLIL